MTTNTSPIKKTIIILIHAVIGWGLCFAKMGVGMVLFDLQTALIMHAAAAPVIFFIVSLIYFKKFNYTSPFTTALVFMGVVVLLDALVVALLIQQSFEMFTSFIGTQLPFALILLSTWLTGVVFRRPA